MTKYYFNDNQKNIVRLMAQGLQDSSVQPTWTVVRGDDRIMAAWGPSQELSREIEEGRLQEPELDIFIDSGLVKRLSGDEYFLRWQQIIEAANNDFEDPINIELEPVQKDLLFALVEAARNVPNEHRREFSSGTELGLGSVIYHPGLNEGKRTVSLGDLHILQNERLISTFAQNKYDLHFEVTSTGYKLYRQLKRRIGQPVEQVTLSIRSYLDAEQFRQKYPQAYAKWLDAEERLFATDVEAQLTTIGHLCRETMQEFATSLVEKYQPPNVSSNKADTINRLREVIKLKGAQLGETEKPFLTALLAYFGTVSDLIQRQEHGGQKEGTPLVWEDARRAVFQTAVVMFEIDRALSR